MTFKSSLFESFFRENYKTAVFLAYSIVKSYEEAEDIVQDTFIKLLDLDLQKLENPSSYFFRMVRNASIDLLRKSSQVIEHDSNTFPLFTPAADSDEANKEIEYAKYVALLFSAIEKLPDQTQRVLKLISFDNYTYKEAAEILNVSLATIKTHMYRSYKLLRKLIKE